MTTQEIENYINTYRLYPNEYQGKRDYDLIRKLTDYDDYAVKVYYENPERGRKLYEKLVEIGEIVENKSIEKLSLNEN